MAADRDTSWIAERAADLLDTLHASEGRRSFVRAKAIDLLGWCVDEQVPPSRELVQVVRELLGNPRDVTDIVLDEGFGLSDPKMIAAAEFEALYPADPSGEKPSSASVKAINKYIAKSGQDLKRSIRRWHRDQRAVFTQHGSYRNGYHALVDGYRTHPRQHLVCLRGAKKNFVGAFLIRRAATAAAPVKMSKTEFDRRARRLKMLGVDWLDFFGPPHLTFERLEALARLGIKTREDLANCALIGDEQLTRLPPELALSDSEQTELVLAAQGAAPSRRGRGRPRRRPGHN